jgi:hypothetical protein
MVRHVAAVLLGSLWLLQLMVTGQAADDECIRCRQNYEYICLSNFQTRASGCKGFGVADKQACQRRSSHAYNECATRAAEKCGKCVPDKLSLPPPVHIIQ